MAERRQQQRCENPECPATRNGAGRILFEIGKGGMVFKEHGRDVVVTMGPPVMATCRSCGEHWFNPAMLAAAERLAEEAESHV